MQWINSDVVVCCVTGFFAVAVACITYYRSKKLAIFDTYHKRKADAYEAYFRAIALVMCDENSDNFTAELIDALLKISLYSSDAAYADALDFAYAAMKNRLKIDEDSTGGVISRVMHTFRCDIDRCKNYRYR